MKYQESHKRMSNILIDILKSLNIRYTTDYAMRHYKEHPHKDNLYGISQMLLNYGINSIGVKITDKENDTFKLGLPFVAHVGDDFVLVTKYNSQSVSCIWNGEKLSVPPKEFNEKWSGNALLIQSDQNSIEPQYNSNKIISILKNLFRSTLYISIIILLMISYTSQVTHSNIMVKNLLIIINILGLYVSFLLVSKQLHINNNSVDKFCTLIKDGNCNHILESKAAKLLGVIGWSEIGMGYFISNLSIIIFAPSLISYLFVINICALPYTLWSVWYQKIIAKQWCTLCLMVQIILWLIFIVNLTLDIKAAPTINLHNILLVGSIYTIPTLSINLLLPYFTRKEEIEEMKQELNAIKASSDFFIQSIKKEPFYLVSDKNSKIIFGNKNSSFRITILLNPHCNPCKEIYNKANELINLHGDKISIQFIFSSSNIKLNLSSKLLVAIYLNTNQDIARKIFTDWFTGEERQFYSMNAISEDKYNKWAKKEITKYSDLNHKDFDVNKDYINIEFSRHESWKHEMDLKSTPFILINGYKLPDYYKLEDIRHHVNLII